MRQENLRRGRGCLGSIRLRVVARRFLGLTTARAIAAADGGESLIGEGDYAIVDEEDIFAKLTDADAVIADPLYKPALPGIDRQFISFSP